MTPLFSPKGPLFSVFWCMTHKKTCGSYELPVFKGSSSFSFHLASPQITKGECDESSQGHIEGRNKLSPSLRSFLQVFNQHYRVSFFFGLLLIDVILLPMHGIIILVSKHFFKNFSRIRNWREYNDL